MHITPEFMRRANGVLYATGSAAAGQDSDTGERDHLTLERIDPPLQNLLKTLESLKETDPKEAMRLLKATLSDRLFTADADLSRLSKAMDDIGEELRRAKPGGSFEAGLALQSAFMRGMYHAASVSGARIAAPCLLPSPESGKGTGWGPSAP